MYKSFTSVFPILRGVSVCNAFSGFRCLTSSPSEAPGTEEDVLRGGFISSKISADGTMKNPVPGKNQKVKAKVPM